MNNTTRTFPRTSLRQSDAAYGAAIERPRKADKAVNWALCLAVVVIVLSLVYQGAPK